MFTVVVLLKHQTILQILQSVNHISNTVRQIQTDLTDLILYKIALFGLDRFKASSSKFGVVSGAKENALKIQSNALPTETLCPKITKQSLFSN